MKFLDALLDRENKETISSDELVDLRGKIAALEKSQGVIEFSMEGIVLNANENFLKVIGYSLDEIKGKHHSMFVDEASKNSHEYKVFWERLNKGMFNEGQFRRVGKNNKEVWIQASYNPVMNLAGKPIKIVKYATDITQDKLRNADYMGQLAAISKVQAVIEFDLQGMVLNANENFLNTFGYSLDEIRGKHHRLFVDRKFSETAEYKTFWENLARGQYDSGEYKRIGKNGSEVWIQASYNPILDANGRPFKVVKYATNITDSKLKNADYQGQLAAINKAQGVIEFNLDGSVRTANENFLAVLGYQLDEIKGQHHRMFVEPSYSQSNEYKLFWQKLASGEYDAGQYKRIGKGGREVWIQASYNPIFDSNNRPFKVVKYATDITAQINAANALKNTVEQVQAAVNAAIANDLTVRIPMHDKSGMLEELAGGVNSLLDTITEIVEKIKISAGEIFVGAREISTGNSDLSSRTEQQAANLEETASSMEELTSTVKLNADNAKQANSLSDQASQIAMNGGETIQQVVATMEAINQSSKKISDIIGVIDGIAFQTNILALNAAVEAARAGDQGRGFAVVASEVRTLAQRSATAAKDIKNLISDSVAKIGSGNVLVAKSGDTMKEIVLAIKRVNDIMAEIAAASAEQSTGIDEISTAVSQMDEMTQQNAALVEQAAAAAESLESQANTLNSAVAKFKLTNSHNLPAASKTPISPKKSLAASASPASVRKKIVRGSSLAEDEWESF